MAVVAAEGGRTRGEQPRLLHRREQQEQRSPGMATPPRPRPPRPRPGPSRVAVVYYLSRNGQLEHPHFMEVAVSSGDGICLRDVTDRLDALRGKGMARMYSWASKRSYRSGFVWHDLAADDLICPVAGQQEYVLKGTERPHPVQLPLLDASSCSQETAASSSSGWEHGSAAVLGEYRVYKSEESAAAEAAAAAADAATQTEDDSYRGRIRGHQRRAQVAQEELTREETSPPTASTSPETFEARLIKADVHGRVAAAVTGGGGRTRASSVLMQLISCGSMPVKSALTTPVLPHCRRPRPTAAPAADHRNVAEDKEYFSGSIVETTKRSSSADTSRDSAVLRRSSSYGADVSRAKKVEQARELHDRCIPRKPRARRVGA